jgi:ABC-type branched-subunit amino acid transport system ATPase component
MAEPLLALEGLNVTYGQVRAIAGSGPCGKGARRLRRPGYRAMPSDRRTALGLAPVAEGRQVFGDRTVSGNLLMGGYRLPRDVKRRMDDMFTRFPRLAERRSPLAAILVRGQAADARRLTGWPRLMVLAEQSAPMAVSLADRTCLLELGQVVLTGDAAVLRQDKTLREGYPGSVTV